jgi:restriction system protein
LDQVLVQAKRYDPTNIISRQTIQAFIGSLTGQGVTKGIFITTSSFAATAGEYVLRGAPIKVVLVDGSQLIDLMIRHRIGVRVAHTYAVHELDQNYFEDSE